MTILKVTKLDAARRQLETVVRLYFSDGDPVSIHTLTSAAYQVLADVNRARGGKPMLKEQAPTWVRADATVAAKRKLSEAENFFKHADRDHDEVLEFSTGPTELLLFDAITKYQELTGELVPVFAVYGAWFWLGPGSELVTTPEHQRAREAAVRAFPGATRSSFFAEVLPLLSSVRE